MKEIFQFSFLNLRMPGLVEKRVGVRVVAASSTHSLPHICESSFPPLRLLSKAKPRLCFW